jgi:hypothetical protein
MRGECSGHFGSGKGRRSIGFVMRKKKAGQGRLGRPGGRGPVGRGRASQLGRKGGGRGWAENQSWAKVQEIKSFQILIGIWIFGKL